MVRKFESGEWKEVQGKYDFSIYPYLPFWYIIVGEIGSLIPHGISAFGAVPCDNSQTNHRSDFWKVGFVVNRKPADLFDVHINSILSLVG